MRAHLDASMLAVALAAVTSCNPLISLAAAGSCPSCSSCASGADISGFNRKYRGYQQNTRLDRYANAAFRPQWYFGGPRYRFVVDDYHAYRVSQAYSNTGCGWGFSAVGFRNALPPRGDSFHSLERFISGPSMLDVWEQSRLDAARYEFLKSAFPPDFVHQNEQERKHAEFTRHLMNDEGWKLIELGKGREAIAHFSRLAVRHRGNGAPKIAFALACAIEGDDNVAAASMRHALQTDPQSLNHFTANESLRQRMHAMLERYGQQEGQHYRRNDALIMTASLHYLLGQFDESQSAIARVLSDGDKFQSTLGLQRLAVRAAEHRNSLAMNAQSDTLISDRPDRVGPRPSRDSAVSRETNSQMISFAWFEAD